MGATAVQENAHAQYSLGVLYINGWGVPRNYGQAPYWWESAAGQGLADAQFKLGSLYTTDQSVPKDLVQAHMWFNLSSANGRIFAANERDYFAKWMTPAQIDEAQKLVREWKPMKP